MDLSYTSLPAARRLLVFERLDGVHLRGTVGGERSKDGADHSAGDQRDDHGPQVDGDIERREHARGNWQCEADQHAYGASDQRDEDGFDKELEFDLAGRRAHRLANTDFADACTNRSQHDVHNAYASDCERDGGDEQQQDGQCIGDDGRGGKDRGKRCDGIDRVALMARLRDCLDFFGRLFHVVLIAYGEEDVLHIVGSGEIAGDGVRNKDGLIVNFRRAEGIYALLKGSDDGKGKAGELKGLIDGRVGSAKHLAGEGLSDYGDLGVGGLVLFVEESPR